jgi:hypothetical protein
MKKRWLVAVVSIALLVGPGAGAGQAPPAPAAQDIGIEVGRIFAFEGARCDAAPAAVQKETIRAWIAAGAPDAISASAPLASSDRAGSTDAVQSSVFSIDRIVRWLGKFHLLALHFPIALVLAAGAGEMWSVWKRSRVPSETVRFCLWLGALIAVPTAGLGWLFAAAGHGASSAQLLMVHRWLGTTSAIWLIVAAVCAERDLRRGARSRYVRFLIMFGVLIIALTAHIGGLIAHGVHFFAY